MYKLLVLNICFMLCGVESIVARTHFSTGWAPGFGVGKREWSKDYPAEDCADKLPTYMRIVEKIYADGNEEVISYAVPLFKARIERLSQRCQEYVKAFMDETNRIDPNGAKR